MDSISEKDRHDCLQWLLFACESWIINTKTTQAATNSSSKPEKNNYPILIEPGLKWEILKKMAYVHGLEPILFDLDRRNIMPTSNFPDHIKKAWENAYFSNVIQNTEFLDIFSKVLAESEKRGLSIIALKGLASLGDIYKELGLRIMVDIDILCKKSDLKILSDIAFDLGFRRQGSLLSHHLVFYHQDHGFPIEFHFTPQYIVKRKKILMALFWERRRWAKIDNIRIPVLSLEDQLIFEVGHILDHNYFISLKHYLDFGAKLFILEDRIDWTYLSSILTRSGLIEDFLCLCTVLSELMSIPLKIKISSNQSQHKFDQVKGHIYGILISMGFDRIQIVGYRSSSFTNLYQKLDFTLKRFFPPLNVVQAAYRKKSLFSAVLAYPHHIYVTLYDLWKRRKTEKASSRY